MHTYRPTHVHTTKDANDTQTKHTHINIRTQTRMYAHARTRTRTHTRTRAHVYTHTRAYIHTQDQRSPKFDVDMEWQCLVGSLYCICTHADPHACTPPKTQSICRYGVARFCRLPVLYMLTYRPTRVHTTKDANCI